MPETLEGPGRQSNIRREACLLESDRALGIYSKMWLHRKVGQDPMMIRSQLKRNLRYTWVGDPPFLRDQSPPPKGYRTVLCLQEYGKHLFYVVLVSDGGAPRNQDSKRTWSRKGFNRTSDIPEFVPNRFAVKSPSNDSCFSSRLHHGCRVVVILVADNQVL